MLEIYIASIVLYALVWGWLGKLSVADGDTITVEKLFWFVVLGILPIAQQSAILFGILVLFEHYKNKPIFGGKK